MADSDYILGAFREMAVSDLQGGSCSFPTAIRGAVFSCTLGVFDLEDPLAAAGGGHTPRLMGTIEIATEDIPEGASLNLKTGLPVDVTDGAGATRNCKVDSWRNVGPVLQISLVDINQGA